MQFCFLRPAHTIIALFIQELVYLLTEIETNISSTPLPRPFEYIIHLFGVWLRFKWVI
jgi:hypothetical protein